MKNFSVGQRLAVLVGVPLVIIILLVVSSLSSFSSINQGVRNIYDDRVVPLTQLKSIMDGYTTIINAINKADNGLKNPNEALAEFSELSGAEREQRLKQNPRWCRVEYQGQQGWVAGRYLREGTCQRKCQQVIVCFPSLASVGDVQADDRTCFLCGVHNQNIVC